MIEGSLQLSCLSPKFYSQNTRFASFRSPFAAHEEGEVSQPSLLFSREVGAEILQGSLT